MTALLAACARRLRKKVLRNVILLYCLIMVGCHILQLILWKLGKCLEGLILQIKEEQEETAVTGNTPEAKETLGKNLPLGF